MRESSATDLPGSCQLCFDFQLVGDPLGVGVGWQRKRGGPHPTEGYFRLCDLGGRSLPGGLGEETMLCPESNLSFLPLARAPAPVVQLTPNPAVGDPDNPALPPLPA